MRRKTAEAIFPSILVGSRQLLRANSRMPDRDDRPVLGRGKPDVYTFFCRDFGLDQP